MKEEYVFHPDRTRGYVFHALVILFFAGAGLLGLWKASQASLGPAFFLYLLPPILALGIIPVLAYRVYALRTAHYILERDGIRLRWGLRLEEIPISQVFWIHLAQDLTKPLPLPRLYWPGSVLGMRRLSHAEKAGNALSVEFLASSSKKLLVIATPNRFFAISPADPKAFLEVYQRLTELGSLYPLEARSVYPSLLINRVWRARPARWLLIGGLTLSLALLVWVSLAIPLREQVVLGFRPDGSTGDLVPAVRLFLLPVVNSMFFVIDLLVGLFFFRQEDNQPLAYLLWGGGAFTSVLFLVAVFFILRAS